MLDGLARVEVSSLRMGEKVLAVLRGIAIYGPVSGISDYKNWVDISQYGVRFLLTLYTDDGWEFYRARGSRFDYGQV